MHVWTSHNFSDFIVYWFQVLANSIFRPWGETAGVEMRSRVTWVFHLLHPWSPPCRCISQEEGRWRLPVQVYTTGSCPGVVGGHPVRIDKSRGSHASGKVWCAAAHSGSQEGRGVWRLLSLTPRNGPLHGSVSPTGRCMGLPPPTGTRSNPSICGWWIPLNELPIACH